LHCSTLSSAIVCNLSILWGEIVRSTDLLLARKYRASTPTSVHFWTIRSSLLCLFGKAISSCTPDHACARDTSSRIVHITSFLFILLSSTVHLDTCAPSFSCIIHVSPACIRSTRDIWCTTRFSRIVSVFHCFSGCVWKRCM
jgi:hypothetical protein